MPLCNHLREVAEATVHYLKAAGITSEPLLNTAQLIGLGHDFGKYSAYFQHRLHGRSVKRGLSSHAASSALFTAWLVDQVVPEDYKYLKSIAFSCVLQHHGHLQNLRTVRESLTRQEKHISAQLSSIGADVPRIANELEELFQTFNLNVEDLSSFLSKYSSIINSVKKELNQLRYALVRCTHKGWPLYFQTLLLFSSLIDADKKDAAGLHRRQRLDLASDLVDRFRRERFKDAQKTTMDALRSNLYDDAMRQLDTLLQNPNPPRIMTITAPTGIGKTLVGLAAALKLRHHLVMSQKQSPPRIIYSLPYINIIEQNYDVFRNVVETSGLKTTPHLLLKHHHLALTKPTEDENLPLHHRLLLQESWDTELVVTTFVQLLYTLVGYRNRFLKKFHNLYNAIIILDEVQAIPIDYWFLVRELFTHFAEQANSYILFMTATQPLIFPSSVTYELVPNHEKYFHQLNRTCLIYEPDKAHTPEEAAVFALNQWSAAGSQSLLIVANTIGTSIEIYKKIKNLLAQHGKFVCFGIHDETEVLESSPTEPVLAYLSTNIVPKERHRRIFFLRKLLSQKRPVIVVATQVIEAGVDLDFNLVVRDIGPIDTINQVAGRCNRSATEKMGKVYVIRMESDDGTPYAKYVYRGMHIRIAEELLQLYSPHPEREFPTLLNQYQNRVRNYEGEVSKVSNELLKAIQNLRFEELAEFKLIEDKPKALRIPVFIELDLTAQNIRVAFRNALEQFKEADRSQLFDLRAQLKRHLVAVRSYIVEVWERDNPPPGELAPLYSIKFVDKEESSKYYDRETGYRREALYAVIW